MEIYYELVKSTDLCICLKNPASSIICATVVRKPYYVNIFMYYFQLLRMMVGANISEEQLGTIADRTLSEADVDQDGYVSFDEFSQVWCILASFYQFRPFSKACLQMRKIFVEKGGRLV